MPEQRVLATKVDKTVEEMVRQLDQELDKELAFLRPAPAETATEAGTTPTVAQPNGVPDQRVPAAAETELEKLGIENKQFTNSFVAVEVPKVPPGPPIRNRKTWKLNEMVEEQPKWGQKPGMKIKNYGEMGSTTQELPSDEIKQLPPYIDPAVHPPPDQDQYRHWYGYALKGCGKHQLKGCRRGRVCQTTLAKGVLDIG
jgi:hypothetical protein